MTKVSNSTILENVVEYYLTKLAKYRESLRCVDWNGDQNQALNFAQNCKLFGKQGHLSINDPDYGYSALDDFPSEKYGRFFYSSVKRSQA
mgnify:CR=1 FL=1|jgi:hypothetical protein